MNTDFYLLFLLWSTSVISMVIGFIGGTMLTKRKVDKEVEPKVSRTVDVVGVPGLATNKIAWQEGDNVFIADTDNFQYVAPQPITQEERKTTTKKKVKLGAVRRPRAEDIERTENPRLAAEEKEMEKAFEAMGVQKNEVTT